MPSGATVLVDQQRRKGQLATYACDVLRHFDVKTTPVRLDLLPWPRDTIDICAKDLQGYCDGLLRWNVAQRRFYLYYDDRHPARARFNLAHELAHYLIPDHAKVIRRGSAHQSKAEVWSTTRPMEIEADHMAAELLVPAYLYDTAAFDLSCVGISKLKEAFDVSYPCAGLKLIEHASEPATLICYEAGRIAWWRTNTAMNDLEIGGMTIGGSAPRAVRSDALLVPGTHDIGEFRASDWFDRVQEDLRVYVQAHVVEINSDATAYVLVVGAD